MSEFLYHPFPKYLQIREILHRRLRLLKPGDRLPTETELSQEFKVSRVTVRQVLEAFANEGIIERRRRLGTVLRVVPREPADNRLTGPIEEFGNSGLETRIVNLTKGEIAAENDVATALRIEPGDPVYEIRRARMFADAPLLVLEALFPVTIGKRLARRNVTGLYVPVLRKMIDENIREEHQQIDALIAGKKFAKVLQIPEQAPILCVKRLFLDSKGAPVVFFKENFRADRYFYTVRLPQPASARS